MSFPYDKVKHYHIIEPYVLIKQSYLAYEGLQLPGDVSENQQLQMTFMAIFDITELEKAIINVVSLPEMKLFLISIKLQEASFN